MPQLTRPTDQAYTPTAGELVLGAEAEHLEPYLQHWARSGREAPEHSSRQEPP